MEIIWLYHDVPLARHREKWKMTELVIQNYWWLGVTKDMEKYVKECNIYQKMKNRTEVLMGKLKLSKVSEKPWTYLTVDFIMKLLLVVCNRLPKMTHLWQ